MNSTYLSNFFYLLAGHIDNNFNLQDANWEGS